MNTTKLRKNKKFNSYKDICDFIGETVKKNAKDKEIQLEQWKKYFEFHIEGRKFIIDKVIIKSDDIQLENGNKNKGGHNTSKFAENINPIVLDMLSKLYIKGTYDICLSTTTVLKTFIGFDNPIIEEYNNIDGTKGDIKKRVILDFMSSKRRKIMGIVNTSLNTIKKKGGMLVNTNCMRAKLYNGNYIWLKDEEVSKILTIRQKVLEDISSEVGFEINLSNLRKYGLSKRYNERLKKGINNLGGIFEQIDYTFEATKIILSEQFSELLLERKQFLEYYDNFNDKTKVSDKRTIENGAVNYSDIKGNDLNFSAEVYANNNGIIIKGDKIRSDKMSNGFIGDKYLPPTKDQILKTVENDSNFKDYIKNKEEERYLVYKETGNNIIEELYDWIEEHKNEIDGFYGYTESDELYKPNKRKNKNIDR